jgi:hypothetical protein
MNGKKFAIVIIILILIIIGLAGYIGFNYYKEKQEDAQTTTVINDVTIDLNSFYQIGDTLNRLDNAFNDVNSTYFGYLYKQDSLSVSDLDPSVALYATIHDDMVGSNTTQYLIGTKVKNNFEKMFGKSLTYTPTNIVAGNYINITYDTTTDRFSYTTPTVTNIYSPEYVISNIKTTLESDKVTVTRKIFYVEYVSNNGGTDITSATIYTSSDKKTVVGTIKLKNNVLSASEVVAKYGSKLKTFKYTFKENSNNNYTFNSIELVK